MAAENCNRPARPISACFSTNKRFFLSASGDARPWAAVADQTPVDSLLMRTTGGL